MHVKMNPECFHELAVAYASGPAQDVRNLESFLLLLNVGLPRPLDLLERRAEQRRPWPP